MMHRHFLIRSLILAAVFLLGSELNALPAEPSLAEIASAPEEQTLPCTPGPTTLCLNDSRFKISASWRTPAGQSGAARAVRLTPDTGYFWFFQNTNVEFVVKVINGCGLSNGRYWVFAGGLTNVQVDLRVEDTRNGAVKTYRNPQNTAFRPIQDTDAFSCRGRRERAVGEEVTAEGAGEEQAEQWADFLATAERLQAATGPALSLRQNRFRVSATWRRPNGQTGTGTAVPLTDETGYFWFFDPSNVEMILKVLDGCALSNRFWVFAAGLTNVQVDIRVEDLQTGAVKTYRNPQNTAFRPIQDTSAFSTCGTDGLPPDPGQAGRQTIAGIDSDRDGIRDDLQRFIHLTYRDAETVSSLRQAARTVQSTLTSGTASQAENLATSMLRDMECLFAVRPDDADEIGADFMGAALNTPQRGRAYLELTSGAGGGVYPLKPLQEWNTSCSFPARNVAAVRLGFGEGQEKAVCGEGKETTIFFVNGVLTFRATADQALAHLASSSAAVLPREDFENVQFTLAYNPTFLVLDLWEAVRQRLENDFSRFYRYLAGREIMPDFMANALRAQAAAVDVVALLNSPTAINHILTYKREILEGRKVVLVAHSQGNFFANRAYMSLSTDEKRSTGIVAVANPDSAVADGRPYTTLTNDLVIAATPLALPGNTTNSSSAAHDFLHHGFIESYLVAGTASRSRILGHLRNAIDTVESPVAGVGEGVITVTLTWGAQPDVDLHVFEPGGEHVYYANLQGTSGFLDLDDVTSFGPEHYFASCSSLQTGTYQVGVNYFSGLQPETAVIQIQAGLLVRTFEARLSSARGFSGDNSPLPVANIVVTGNARDGYQFQIQ